MVKQGMKVGEIFEDNGGYFKVMKVNADGSYYSELQIGYVPDSTINEETIAELKEVVKAPVKKAPAKKPTSKKK